MLRAAAPLGAPAHSSTEKDKGSRMEAAERQCLTCLLHTFNHELTAYFPHLSCCRYLYTQHSTLYSRVKDPRYFNPDPIFF